MNTITLGKENPDQSISTTTITDLSQTTPLGKSHRRGFPDRIASLIVALFLVGVSTLSMVGQDVRTFHNDRARSGIQRRETSLTPSNVNTNLFGKLRSFGVDADVYAQPLYISKYKMADGERHNVLFVATAHDSVYAFDADGNNPADGYLWRVSLLGHGETYVSFEDVNTTDIKPAIGVVGTPVIARSNGTLYVVAKSKTSGGNPVFKQRLHALNLADGTEKLHGPTLIQATLPGTGDGGSTVSFDPLLNNQRCALLLSPVQERRSATGDARNDGTSDVFITWASHGDNGQYHGWVLSYNAANISQQTGAWVDTPNGSQGGIWMSAGGLSADTNGSIYGASGNGTFDGDTGGSDFSSTLFKLNVTSSGVSLADWFTPFNQLSLSLVDQDFGVGGAPLVLPDQKGPIPHLILTADKSGQIYLLNRDNLGHFNAVENPDVQDFSDGGFPVHSNLVFFKNALYLAPDGGPLEQFAFNPKIGKFDPAATAVSGHTFGCTGCVDGQGSNFTISANGDENGIVWAIDYTAFGTGPAVLYAFDAANVANELYDSTQAGTRDRAAVAVKFTAPTVANGNVYIGGRNAVTVYGLLSTEPCGDNSLQIASSKRKRKCYRSAEFRR
jgi:hypothetical protein